MNSTRRQGVARSLRIQVAIYSAIVVLAICVSLLVAGENRGGKVSSGSQENSAAKSAPVATASSGYVGSQACARCHRAIFNSYSRTGMGRSMSLATPDFLRTIPNSASVFDAHLNRHFDFLDLHLHTGWYRCCTTNQ